MFKKAAGWFIWGLATLAGSDNELMKCPTCKGPRFRGRYYTCGKCRSRLCNECTLNAAVYNNNKCPVCYEELNDHDVIGSW